MPVKQVILSPIPEKIVPTTKTYTDLLEAVLDKGMTVTTASRYRLLLEVELP